MSFAADFNRITMLINADVLSVLSVGENMSAVRRAVICNAKKAIGHKL